MARLLPSGGLEGCILARLGFGVWAWGWGFLVGEQAWVAGYRWVGLVNLLWLGDGGLAKVPLLYAHMQIKPVEIVLVIEAS